ncbi:MAG: hypothetical protein AAF267_23730 [Deinococcota bacterium]
MMTPAIDQSQLQSMLKQLDVLLREREADVRKAVGIRLSDHVWLELGFFKYQYSRLSVSGFCRKYQVTESEIQLALAAHRRACLDYAAQWHKNDQLEAIKTQIDNLTPTSGSMVVEEASYV